MIVPSLKKGVALGFLLLFVGGFSWKAVKITRVSAFGNDSSKRALIVNCSGSVNPSLVNPNHSVNYAINSYTSGWIPGTRYIYGQPDTNKSNQGVRLGNQTHYSVKVQPNSGDKITFFTNLHKTINGITYFCRWDSQWYPRPPYPGAKCNNSCKVSSQIIGNNPKDNSNDFLNLSGGEGDITLKLKSRVKGGLNPIWQTVDVHTLETFFSKHADKKPRNWLRNLFPYFKYARVTTPFGSVNPCIVKKRSGEEYRRIFQSENNYVFSQFDRWLGNLLQSGLYPEFIIKGVAPDKYFLGNNQSHINSYYTYVDANSIAAPPNQETDRHFVNYIDTIYNHMVQKWGRNTVDHFHWLFWHEPWGYYNPLLECDNMTTAFSLQKNCNFNKRFEKYYEFYKMYYQDSLKKFGKVKAVPVFSVLTPEERQGYFGNDNYWFRSFIRRANADGLNLPYIAINPYYHIRYMNGKKVYHLEESLAEIKNILKGTRYEHLPIYATEVSVQHDVTEYGASGLAYLYDLFDKNGIVEMNTWLVHNYFSYNYWAGDYQDPTKWIKTPTTNVWAMLQQMANQPQLELQLEDHSSLGQKAPAEAKIGARATKNGQDINIWGYYFIGGYDHNRSNPDAISSLHRPIDLKINFNQLKIDDNQSYKVELYLIDHSHSNFWDEFRQDHPQLSLSYFPQKREWYDDSCQGAGCCRDCSICSPSHNQGHPRFNLTNSEISKYQQAAELEKVTQRNLTGRELKELTIHLPAWSVFMVKINPLQTQRGKNGSNTSLSQNPDGGSALSTSPTQPIILKGDLNRNGIPFDRGDVLCAISGYLYLGGQAKSLSGRALAYDTNNDKFFNRSDVINFIVSYLKQPRNGPLTSCFSLE